MLADYSGSLTIVTGTVVASVCVSTLGVIVTVVLLKETFIYVLT